MEKKSQVGFTLIEVMVVVVIVAILASLAYPSYMSQVRKSRRSDAFQGLAAIVLAQEKWASKNQGAYADGAVLATAWDSGGLGISTTTSGGYYTLSVSKTVGVNEYVATATAVVTKSQNKDTGCKSLTITVNSSVNKGEPVYAPASCWSK